MRGWLLVTALFVVLLLLPAEVSAHANLATADPGPNALLTDPPPRIVLTFTEVLDRSFSDVAVTDTDGNQVTEGSVVFGDGDRSMTVVLRLLEDGIYSVAWRCLSTVDGHITEGVFAFGVGNISVAELLEANDEGETQTSQTGGIWSMLSRALSFLGLAAIAGTVLFGPLVLRRVLRSMGRGDSIQLWESVNRWSLVGGGTALALGSLGLAIVNAGLSDVSIIEHLTASRPGNWILVRLLAGLTLILLGFTRVHFSISLAVAAVGAFTFSASSHAAAVSTIGMVTDAVHLLAVMGWVGALGQVAVLPYLWSRWSGWETEKDEQFTVALLHYFSRLMPRVVVVIVATGALDIWLLLRVPPWDPIYIGSLVTKLVLVAIMLALGYLNSYHWIRKMEPQTPGFRPAATKFTWTVRSELALAITILMLTGVLTTLSPTDTAVESELTSAIYSSSEDGLEIDLKISPGPRLVAGFHIYQLVLEEDGDEFEGAWAVDLEFTHPRIGTEILRLDDEGGGEFMSASGLLSRTGDWDLIIKIRRADVAQDTFVDHQVTVHRPPPPEFPTHNGIALRWDEEPEVEVGRNTIGFALLDEISGARVNGSFVEVLVLPADLPGLSGGAADSGDLEQGESWTWEVFLPDGEYPFHCHPHPWMEANVTVSDTGPQTVEVEIVNFEFVPENITIQQGGEVVVTNQDTIAHTYTFGAGSTVSLPPAVAPIIAAEDTSDPGHYEITFEIEDPGPYYLEVHVDGNRSIFFLAVEASQPREVFSWITLGYWTALVFSATLATALIIAYLAPLQWMRLKRRSVETFTDVLWFVWPPPLVSNFDEEVEQE